MWRCRRLFNMWWYRRWLHVRNHWCLRHWPDETETAVGCHQPILLQYSDFILVAVGVFAVLKLVNDIAPATISVLVSVSTDALQIIGLNTGVDGSAVGVAITRPLDVWVGIDFRLWGTWWL